MCRTVRGELMSCSGEPEIRFNDPAKQAEYEEALSHMQVRKADEKEFTTEDLPRYGKARMEVTGGDIEAFNVDGDKTFSTKPGESDELSSVSAAHPGNPKWRISPVEDGWKVYKGEKHVATVTDDAYEDMEQALEKLNEEEICDCGDDSHGE